MASVEQWTAVVRGEGNVQADNEAILLKFSSGATSPVTPVCLCLIDAELGEQEKHLKE